MSARTIQLDITILGREFKVACKENEREELSEAVALLDLQLVVSNRLHDELGAMPRRVARFADAGGGDGEFAERADAKFAEGDVAAVERGDLTEEGGYRFR